MIGANLSLNRGAEFTVEFLLGHGVGGQMVGGSRECGEGGVVAEEEDEETVGHCLVLCERLV